MRCWMSRSSVPRWTVWSETLLLMLATVPRSSISSDSCWRWLASSPSTRWAVRPAAQRSRPRWLALGGRFGSGSRLCLWWSVGLVGSLIQPSRAALVYGGRGWECRMGPVRLARSWMARSCWSLASASSSLCDQSLGCSSCPTSLRCRVIRLDVVVQGWVVWVGLRCAVPVLATRPRLVWERVAVAQGLAHLVVVVVCAVGGIGAAGSLCFSPAVGGLAGRVQIESTILCAVCQYTQYYAGRGPGLHRGGGGGGDGAYADGRACRGKPADCWEPRGLWRDRG
jgi:hypothetical protein